MRTGPIVSAKEQIAYESVNLYLDGQLTIAELAALLGKSERQAYRLVAEVKATGLQGVIHKNSGRVPTNKTPELFEERIKSLIRRRYFDFNMTHLRERLLEVEGIDVKRENLRRICKSIGMVKNARRCRRRAHPVRERHAKAGFLLQLDGSYHEWIRGEKWCLLSAIDDATSEIVHASFCCAESTIECLNLLRSVLAAHGCPLFFYTDRAGVYGGAKRQNFSHFERACEELGIKIIYANSPQGKGRIERSYRTLQDRLIPELRRARIRDMGKANAFLWEEFIPKQWGAFTVKAKDPFSAWRKPPEGCDLERILSMRFSRKIQPGECFSWESRTYRVESPEGASLAGHCIEVRFTLENRMECYLGEQKLNYRLVQRRAS